MYWLIFWQNTFYLQLGKSKLGSMYLEEFFSNISSGIIKYMKIYPRNNWRNVVSLKLNTSLNTSIYRELMVKLDTSSIYQDLRFQNSHIWNLAHNDWIIRVSLSTTLDHIKCLFKSHQRHRESIRELIR